MKPPIRPARWMGEIQLAQPLSTAWLAGLSLLISAVVLGALFTVDYTRKERVTGQLSLDTGLVKIYSPFATGVVTKKLVKEGATVIAGQALFVISLERVSSMRGDTQAEISRQIAERKKHLAQEREKQSKVMLREEATLAQRIVFLKQEIDLLTQEVQTHTKRLKLSQAALARGAELFKQSFISAARLEEIEQEVLDQQLKQQLAERNLTTMRRDLNQFQSDLANLPLTTQNRLSETDRQILALDQEAIDSEGRRELVITAPQSGLITTILFEAGQTMQADKPLAALLPSNAKLQASIYLPSRAYGFVEKNLKVLLRYPAYPYQKFGQYSGKISEISRTALSPEELKVTGQATGGSLYRLLIDLDTQTIQAYGKPVALQEGLQVEADILIDTRKLYEWVLEPLYSVVGKL